MKKLFGFLAILALGLGMAQTTNPIIRVAHLSPDAPNVDVWLNGFKALTNVPFKGVSVYMGASVGDVTVWVVPAGKTEPKVIDAKLKLEAGKTYTVAATGMLAPAAGQQAFGAQVYVDNTDAPAAGNAHIRVIHTSPNAPAVDIALKGGAVLIPNLAYPAASNYLPVPAGTYNLEVRAAGTTTVALPLDGVKLEAGKVYTVFAVGLLGDAKSPLTVVVAVDR